MIRETRDALLACVVTFLICAVAYPAVVWGLGSLIFPHQAEGSLIYSRDRKVIGSELVAQPFASEKYFFPRPSAIDYKAEATGGSNLGTKNPDLRKKVIERAEALKATTANPVPVDLISASGGGLDPHITPAAAEYQVARVAAARNVPAERIREVVQKHEETSGAILGASARINVLKLNLALDDELPATAAPSKPAAASTPATGPSATVEATKSTPPSSADAKTGDTPAAADTPEKPKSEGADLSSLQNQAKTISERVDQLQHRLDTIPAPKPAPGLEELERRVAKVSESVADVPNLVALVAKLDDRLKAGDETLKSLRADVDGVRQALKAAEPPAPKVLVPDLNAGLEPFKAGRYAEALGAFRVMCLDHPDDAPVWYLGALASGLSTKQWRGETEALVNKGVEREKAGTPPSAEIDAALSGLTKETGKDWLTFYRERAKK